MENKKKQEEITKALKDFPSDKYPNYIGISLLRDEKITVGILYENENHKWLNTVNDVVYPLLDPVEQVYRVLALGAEPFHISDEIHKACWKETTGSIDDDIGNFFHGRLIYFNYCEQHGINEEYMIKLGGEEIAQAGKRLKCLATLISKNAEKELMEYSPMEETTKECYRYLLNEPYYKEVGPAFTLSNKDGTDTKSVFYYDFYNFVSIIPDTYPELFDYQDWAFNYEEDLFDVLQNGKEIRFMALDTHSNIIVELYEGIGQNYYDKYTKGIHHYLTYAKENHIEWYVDETFKSLFKKVYEHYGIKNKQKNHLHER